MVLVPTPNHGERGKRQKRRERQMDRAGFGGVEEPEIKHVRQRRCDPELKKRPDQWDDKQKYRRRPGHRPAPGFCLEHFVDLRDVNATRGGGIALDHGGRFHRKFTDKTKTAGSGTPGSTTS